MTTCEHFNVEEGSKGNGLFRVLIVVGLMKTTTNNVIVSGVSFNGVLDAQVWTFPIIVQVLAKRTRV